MTILKTAQAHYQKGEREEARQVIIEGSATAELTPEEFLKRATLAQHYLDHDTACDLNELLVTRLPDNLEYRNLWATALTQKGEFETARKQLDEAIARDSSYALSYFNLSLIHHATPGDPLIQTVDDMLCAGVDHKNNEYLLRLTLAKWLDDTGDFDNAFAQIHSAKQSAPVQYDHNAYAAFFDRIKTIFSKDFCEARTGQGDPSPAPIFILGMPRSGSSLLETLLGSHDGVAPLGERVELSHVTQHISQDHQSPTGYLDAISQLTKDDFQKYGRDYCDSVSALAPGAQHFVDKNLLNFQRAALIDFILPKSQIVHLRRDPLDLCLSSYFQTLNPAIFPFIFDLENLGRYYLLYDDLMAHWHSVLPDRIIEMDYESLVSDPDSALAPLRERAGLQSAKDKNAELENVVATASTRQARQPIHETSALRWKNYARHLQPLIAILEQGDALKTP